ncbi:MAG: ubiquitin-like small modifier protein 1 [Verrucomicrobiota bacterium]
MSIKVRVPTPLRNLTNDQEEIEIDGESIKSILDNLESKHPGLKARICDEQGELRRFVNLYLNDEDIRFKDGLDSEIKDGDVLSIVPAIAGG